MKKTEKLGRRVLGRKGIGKLSVFGAAKTVNVKSVRKGKVTEFQMNIDDIKNETSGTYKPKPIRINIDTDDKDGFTVTLKELKRIRKIDIDHLRKGLARRFLLLGNNFTVYVNGDPITKEDKKIDDIEWEWQINESLPEHEDWRITGTIYTRIGTMREQETRGIAVFAGGKLVQEPTYFFATSGKEFAYSHMGGELNAEFIDGKNDVVSSNRSSINWESEEGEVLKEWGRKKVVAISKDWSERRIRKKTENVMKDDEFKEWYDSLSKTEAKRAKRVLNAILGNDELSEEKAKNLANFVKDSFTYAAFQELADTIESSNPEDASLIVQLFQEWEHLEAKEMYRIMEGRIKSIEKLRWYIDNNAKEIPTIHNYLREFPWILHPRWTIVQDEVRYSELLKKKFPDTHLPEKDRRIDFLCFGHHPGLILVELKRPGISIGKKELLQVQEYQDFLEGLKGTDPEFSYVSVYGYLICENIQKSKEVDIRVDKLAKIGIFVKTYSELLSVAENLHSDMIAKYKELSHKTNPPIAKN